MRLPEGPTRSEMIADLAEYETILAQLAAEWPETGNITGEWAGFYNRRVLQLSDLGPMGLEERYRETFDE